MTIGKRQRFRILHRDGFRCRYCGTVAAEAQLEVDHVVPRSRGGTDDDENLATACFNCNRGKAASIIGVTFLGWLHAQIDREDVIGDFARDADGDDRLVEHESFFGLYRQLTGHSIHACSGAISAAWEAWREWRHRDDKGPSIDALWSAWARAGGDLTNTPPEPSDLARADLVAEWLLTDHKRRFWSYDTAQPHRLRGVTPVEVLDMLHEELEGELSYVGYDPDYNEDFDVEIGAHAGALLERCGWVCCPQRHSRETSGVRADLFFPRDAQCPICARAQASLPLGDLDQLPARI